MRTPSLLVSFALAAVLLPASATAGDGTCGAQSVVSHIFEMADEDQDGALTREEYDGAGLPQYGVTFDESDLDSDGRTSMAEYIELYEFHHSGAEKVGI